MQTSSSKTWAFYALDGELLAHIDSSGDIWSPSWEPVGSSRNGGDVVVEGRIVGYTDGRSYWGPKMTYLGWVGGWGRRWVRALGGAYLAGCEEYDCPPALVGAIGVLINHWGLLGELSERRVVGSTPWVTPGSPEVLFPRLMFTPDRGRFTSEATPEEIGEQLDTFLRLTRRIPQRKTRANSEDDGHSEVEDVRSNALINWVQKSISHFDLNSPSADEVRELATNIVGEVGEYALSRFGELNDRQRQLLLDCLYRTLARHADVEGYRPTVTCVLATTKPASLHHGKSNKSEHSGSGWVTGWNKSITSAAWLEGDSAGWSLVTNILEVDPSIAWWLAVREASLARIPTGEPGESDYALPEFIVLDSRGRAWIVLRWGTSASRDRERLIAAAERWTRASIWADCQRDWGALVIPPHLPSGLHWDLMVQAYGVAT